MCAAPQREYNLEVAGVCMMEDDWKMHVQKCARDHSGSTISAFFVFLEKA